MYLAVAELSMIAFCFLVVGGFLLRERKYCNEKQEDQNNYALQSEPSKISMIIANNSPI